MTEGEEGLKMVVRPAGMIRCPLGESRIDRIRRESDQWLSWSEHVQKREGGASGRKRRERAQRRFMDVVERLGGCWDRS